MDWSLNRLPLPAHFTGINAKHMPVFTCLTRSGLSVAENEEQSEIVVEKVACPWSCLTNPAALV
jgi:hypothetical protein